MSDYRLGSDREVSIKSRLLGSLWFLTKREIKMDI
ncbi:MAG: hypothetical protein ACD_41C00332G0003 [uncultured bacterium]|nr:MAG: hypothetical protein ACD_41C00332G0003 [uncultured bacterium]